MQIQRTKIINVDQLTDLIEELKKEQKRLVLVGGCFDILHFGHIKFLREAKKMVDVLMVFLESDENVKKLKGKNRPLQKQMERADILAELESVDFVINLIPMNSDKEYESLIETISPNKIAVTEGDPMISVKRLHAEKIGAELVIIPKLKTQSTSDLAKILGLD